MVAGSIPDWLTQLQTIAVIAIPIVGVWIAHRQMRLAEMKVKHDLFEKRFALYSAAANFVAKILREGKVENPDIMEYSRAILDSEFLLNEGLATYLATLRERAGRLHVYAIDAECPGEGQQTAINKKYAELRFFEDQFEELRRRFRPLLSFEPYGWLSSWRGRRSIKRKK
jgi:hypothetical protein